MPRFRCVILHLQNKSKPVDDVEDEEEDGEGDQEELVNSEIKVIEEKKKKKRYCNIL